MILHTVQVLWIILLLSLSGCFQSEAKKNEKIKNSISIWESRADSSVLLKQLEKIVFSDSTVNDLPIIIIDSNSTLQTIDGFGAALTGSSAFVMNRYLDSAQRLKLIKDLFTPEGVGIDYLRITIGASDFSLKDFSYDDVANDTLMQHFSLEEERADLLPILKEILQVNPAIKIMASPWSAPGWMKSNGSMTGGKLKPEYYRAFARYLVYYIRYMQQEGIRIDAISIQNEPLHGSAAYPCMYMYAPEQRDFIRNHLGPLFQQEGIRTKIILYDHNWDRPLYADTILRDPGAAKYAAGTAFHAYGGDVSAMSDLKGLHPEKDIYFTEISGGRWAPVFGDNLKWYAQNIIIGTMRNHSRNALFWNLALDEHDGPQNRGCSDCRGVVTVTSKGSIQKNVEYYVLAHAGKFIRQGARYCETNLLKDREILNAAFINPNGSRVLLILNSSSIAKTIVLQEGNRFAKIDLEPNAFYSTVWE